MTKTYTDKNGKFATGNTGKPTGARHKATQAALALMDGEAEALIRQAVDMALAALLPSLLRSARSELP